MANKKEITVFIASPGDVIEERNDVRKVCDELNKSNLLKPFGVYFQATGWEDLFPSPGRPQEIINRLVEKCDILVCIFHKRFGSPTGKEESGTLEEFLNAYDSWKKWKKPHIMFYFKEVKITSRKDIEDPQLQKVLDLKEKIQAERTLLFCEFSDDKFCEMFKDHLEKWIIDDTKGWEDIGSKVEEVFKVNKSFKNYLKSAIIEHRFLQTQGFETSLRIPIELENVYVNMKAVIYSHEFDITHEGRKKMDDKVREEGLSSMDIKAAFHASERRKIKDMVILGKPGSGKTTLLKYILVMLLEGKGMERLGIEGTLIPFFAPLRELKDPDREGFTDFIMRVCNLEEYAISKKSLVKLLDEGRGIILMDGLDEVANEETRIKTCHWVDKARRRCAQTRFVVTSRYAGYQGKSRLVDAVVELSIQDFTPEEVMEFLVKWFETVEVAIHPGEDESRWEKEGREKALVLVKTIKKSEHLKKLAVNPLILQIMALVHRDRGRLPQRRVELYEECTNVLLEKWDMAKGLDVLLSAREARQVLQPLALWLHEKDERRSAPMKEIKEVIKEPLEAIGKSQIDPEKLLLNIRDRSGIFMGYSAEEYGFTHLSFQEYLSAEQIRNKGLTKKLLSNYGKKWWSEVILLCLALDNPSIIEAFMEKLIPTENFLNEVALVIDAIHDSIGKPSTPLINAINNRALKPKARYNAVMILKEIGGEKVVQALKEAVDNEDKKLALLAYEVLASRRMAKGVKKPVVGENPDEFINPVDGSKMVLIPAGTFLYGSREDDPIARSDEKPQRVIDLLAFYMDVFPVTNRQFCRFLNHIIPSRDKLDIWISLEGSFIHGGRRIEKKGNKYIVEEGYERYPVVCVSWFGADAYAKWAGKRLPTEEEWEKAARGHGGRKYPWGDKFDSSLCNSHEGGIGGTTEIDKYPKGKSCYGCYDMAGNLSEWTDSWYDESKNFKVLRGGSYYSGFDSCRCSSRSRGDPDDRGYGSGFRCARTL